MPAPFGTILKKTIQCGLVGLTRTKERMLAREYENLQRFLRGDKEVDFYSANKQQAKRYYGKIKDGKEYPISIRKDLIDVSASRAFAITS